MVDSVYKIVHRVIKRRVEAGEDLDTVLSHYTELTNDEREEIKNEIMCDYMNDADIVLFPEEDF